MVLHFLVYNIYLYNSQEEREETNEKQPIERTITSNTQLDGQCLAVDEDLLLPKLATEMKPKLSEGHFNKQEL